MSLQEDQISESAAEASKAEDEISKASEATVSVQSTVEESADETTKSDSDIETSEEPSDESSAPETELGSEEDEKAEEEKVEEEEKEPEPPKEKHPLDGFSDQELIKLVDDLKNETRHLELENMVFEHFLLKNDPSLITGINLVLEAAMKVHLQREASITSIGYPPVRTATEESLRSKADDSTLRVTVTTLSSMQEKGPRINITQKTDLVMRETEEIQTALEKFIKKSHRNKCNLKAEIEEFNIRDAELKESRDIFEQTIVIEGVDKLTQRIPAEKFIRYMEEWLRSAEFTLEKMRLRTSTLFSQYNKVSSQLVLKEELGETLHAVDFEQLQIENQHFLKRIEEKNTHLLELKRTSGRVNLMLTTQKQYLQQQVIDLAKLRDRIKATEKKIDHLDDEAETAEKELEKAQEKYDEIKSLQENYRVPEVLEYVKKKAKLYELQKNLKIWSRRTHIQEIALDTCTRQMKSITGLKHPRLSWYKMPEDLSEVKSFLSE